MLVFRGVDGIVQCFKYAQLCLVILCYTTFIVLYILYSRFALVTGSFKDACNLFACKPFHGVWVVFFCETYHTHGPSGKWWQWYPAADPWFFRTVSPTDLNLQINHSWIGKKNHATMDPSWIEFQQCVSVLNHGANSCEEEEPCWDKRSYFAVLDEDTCKWERTNSYIMNIYIYTHYVQYISYLHQPMIYDTDTWVSTRSISHKRAKRRSCLWGVLLPGRPTIRWALSSTTKVCMMRPT